jgi:DNA-directed RNA polymerase
MLIERPGVPPRVEEAVNKLQRTAWRINRAVLDQMVRKIGTDGEPLSNEEKWILGEAGMLAPFDRFYIPVHLDYRGRMHQGGGLLTYTGGSDLARGLLEFADGERLNDDGVRWLAWHAVQMWGHSQVSTTTFGDVTLVLLWLREHVNWRDAKHPVQYLAAALAFEDANAGKPVHLPVRVDASCSGLQHLALLARDTELAKLVNLWGAPGNNDHRSRVSMAPELPEPDFYTSVAAETGFSRKETKAVIVPLLYRAGGKALGEKLARARRGERARVTNKDKRDAAAIGAMAEKLAPKAFDVLRWFKQVAIAHNSPEAVPIRWTAPSGFKVVQDYRYFDRRIVKVPFDGNWVGLRMRSPAEAVKTWKQEIALPSSVVHSLDASLLTELVARTPIEQWAVAHDAFGIPANRVWELLAANEEATRAMYETDRLAEWTTAWRTAGVNVPDPPEHAETLPPEMLRGLRALG